jgi:hypothetical protein
MVPTRIDARKVIADVAREQGVLLEEDDPLFVALEAHAVVLQEVADQLLQEVQETSRHLKSAVPGEVDAAMRSALESAVDSVRRGLDADIEGASLKARAIVDAVYRAQSRAVIWTWISVGLLAALALFCAGMFVGRFEWK